MMRIFSGPYIAGDSLESALNVVQRIYREQGLLSTLDLLGEGISKREDIAAEIAEYIRMIDGLEDGTCASISLKPTQMGLAFDPEFCKDNIAQIAQAAQKKAISVTIDMEESLYTDATLKLYGELLPQYPLLGTVLQSRLYRTSDDIDRYLSSFQAHIRLCIGIYLEPAEIAYTSKRKMKDNFVTLARKLWENGHFVAIATHDQKLIARCVSLAKEMQIPNDRYEVQMLLGVPRQKLQQQLIREDIPVRLYVPYGTTWEHAYAYARRRLNENPHVMFHVIRNLPRLLTNWFSKSRKQLKA